MDGSELSKSASAEQRRLGLVCAEQISLAIANVKLRDQLRDQSIRDALTGMFNRRYMLETCRREFSRAARAGKASASSRSTSTTSRNSTTTTATTPATRSCARSATA